jgi:hypothetical protein
MGVPPSLSFFSEILVLVSIISFRYLNFIFCGVIFFFVGIYNLYFFMVGGHGLFIDFAFFFDFDVVEHLFSFFHLIPCFVLFLG